MKKADNYKYIPYNLGLVSKHSAQAIISFDLEFKIKSWNPAAEKMFGKTAVKVIGTHILDTISEAKQVADDLNFLKELISGTEPTQKKVLRKHTNGKWFPSRSSGYTENDHANQVIGGTILISDLTGEIYLSEILSEMEELGQVVGWQYFPIDQSVQFTGAANRIVNSEASTWKTISDFFQCFNSDSRKAFQTLIAESSKSGKSGQLEVKSSDEEKIFKISYKTEQANQRIVRIYGIIRDISSEVSDKELIASQELQLISRSRLAAVGELAAGVAHEINNPLAIVSGTVQMMMDKVQSSGLSDKDIKTLGPRLEKGVDRISNIIQGLLRFSRADDEGAPFKEINVNGAIEETISFFQAEFSSSDISVQTKLTKDSPIISGRNSEIGQVMLNIIKNARDFFLDNSVEDRIISIETRKNSEGWMIVSISNSGPKISQDVAENIFQPFFTTKEVGKGTGLGMSVSHSIVNDHSGHMYIDLNQRNTTFILEFPPYQESTESVA